MYQGLNKEGGGIIGTIQTSKGGAIDVQEATETSSAEESLICCDEYGNEIALTASLSATGDVVWSSRYSKESVLRRTVGMSQMVSMLKDNDRNQVYEAAIQKCIEHFISTVGRPPVVLDIGTGTGLLALMSLRHNASYVFGCEMFEPMAQIAQEVIDINNATENIMIINAKSVDIESLPIQPDLIISELLDSSLLGESCVSSHADAISRLLRTDDLPINVGNRVIPNRANVFATLVEGTEIRNMRATDTIWSSAQASGLFCPFRDPLAKECQGGWSMIPVHWSELVKRGARALSSSRPVLNIDFTRSYEDQGQSMEYSSEGIFEEGFDYRFGEGCYETDIVVESDGVVHGILLWWTVFLLSSELDPRQSLHYTTEPGKMNWQDHWQQVVYPLPTDLFCSVGDVIRIRIGYNSIKMWINAWLEKAGKSSGDDTTASFQHPTLGTKRVMTHSEDLNYNDDSMDTGKRSRVFTYQGSHRNTDLKTISPVQYVERVHEEYCTCGWHLLVSSDRLQMINDNALYQKYEAPLLNILERLSLADTVEDIAVKTPIVLDVGDGSILPLVFSKLVQQKRFSINPSDGRKFPVGIVSKESKFFSSLFITQLIAANGLDSLMSVWDGVDIEDIVDLVTSDSTAGADMEEGVGDFEIDSSVDTARAVVNRPITVAALISDCFNYQLTALPTWQAISFHYQRTALHSMLNDHSVICPMKAYITIAAIHLEDLHVSHGTANM